MVEIGPGDTLIFETPGGGGMGEPQSRDRELVRRDLAEGLISPDAARSIYGLDDGEGAP